MMNVEINKTDLRRAELMLIGVKNGANRALANSINRSLTTVRAHASRKIREDITAKAGIVKEHLKIRRASKTGLIGWIKCSGEPLNLIHFQPRITKKGVSVKVKRNGKRVLLKHAFIADIGGGKVYTKDPRFSGTTVSRKGPQVYWRKYKGPRRPIRKGYAYATLPLDYRFPLKNLTGPRIPDILNNDQVMAPILKLAGEQLSLNLSREVKFILSKSA